MLFLGVVKHLTGLKLQVLMVIKVTDFVIKLRFGNLCPIIQLKTNVGKMMDLVKMEKP
jgi:hypothetical protein